MDNDKGSIGGLRNPPPATKKLYYASMVFDGAGLLLCSMINIWLVLLMIVYILISKAYSWRVTRIKKYALTGWLMVMLFQGGYTFMLVNVASQNTFDPSWISTKQLMAMFIASLLIGGFYPLTQIYQHEEDSARGDHTISYKLGINHTFIFSGMLFIVACIVAWNYFNTYYNTDHFLIFIVSLVPVIIYYLHWFTITIKNKENADYTHAMRMTFISSTCMIICFIIIFFLNHAVF